MQLEQLSGLAPIKPARGNNGVETPPAVRIRGEGQAEIAHDACNMITALDIYCDLLDEPGVLAAPFAHYGSELRLVATATRRLVEKLVSPGSAEESTDARLERSQDSQQRRLSNWKSVPPEPITNLAEELHANRSLLAAIAGPSIAVTVDVRGGALPVRMTAEDLTRILVNLVKNAVEAMASAGRIHITLWEGSMDSGDSPWLTLNIEDNGPGLPADLQGRICEQQSSETPRETTTSEWPIRRHGLGLRISRSIVEAAGGVIHAANRDPSGACFQIQLPAVVTPSSSTEHNA